MGKGRDKKKKAGEKAGKIVHGKGAAKTESKTVKGAKKTTKRKMLRMGEGGDDVEAMLASILADGDGAQQVCHRHVPPQRLRRSHAMHCAQNKAGYISCFFLRLMGLVPVPLLCRLSLCRARLHRRASTSRS